MGSGLVADGDKGAKSGRLPECLKVTSAMFSFTKFLIANKADFEFLAFGTDIHQSVHEA